VKFEFTRPARIAAVQLDPARRYQLDLCRANDSRTSRVNVSLAVHWPLRLLFWAQNALLWLSATI